MCTGRILELGAVQGAIQVMAMTITTVRVRRKHRAVRKGQGTGRVQRMGRGKSWGGNGGREGDGKWQMERYCETNRRRR